MSAATAVLRGCFLDPCHADGQDYAQEACATALKRGVAEPEWTTGTLIVLARYAVLDTRRKLITQARIRTFPLHEHADDFLLADASDPDPESRLDARDELAAVLALAQKDRDINAVVLFAQGHRYEEIAALYGLSLERIKKSIWVGRQRLRQVRAERGVLAA